MSDENEQQEVPTVVGTNINVDLIVLRECTFKDHLFDAIIGQLDHGGKPDSIDEVEIAAKVNIWLDPAGKTALVSLRIDADPKVQPTWSASVEVVGQYSCGPNPVIPMKRFVRNNGIAYLVPFARERLSNLVASSVFKGYTLPPMGVQQILALSKRGDQETGAE